MPLKKGAKAKTKSGKEFNLKAELAAGKKRPQALAIMYSEAGEGKSMKAKPVKRKKK